MCFNCCQCPQGLETFLDRRVLVATKCGELDGILRAFGDTFLEVEEDDPNIELTVVQCGQVCFVTLIG